MSIYTEADKQEIAQEICEGCDNYVDGGGYDDAWGARQYFCQMECLEMTEPCNEDCPYHKRYTDIVGEEEEIEDEESVDVLDFARR